MHVAFDQTVNGQGHGHAIRRQFHAGDLGEGLIDLRAAVELLEDVRVAAQLVVGEVVRGVWLDWLGESWEYLLHEHWAQMHDNFGEAHRVLFG